MRVVINELAALGPRTGIGHYTSELLRCLRRQASEDQIDTFPHGWLRSGKLAYSQARMAGASTGGQSRGDHRQSRSLRSALRGWMLDQLRDWGRTAAAWSFRARCARQRYQIYHEPNYIPIPSALPTVVTICDLSVLLHPEWHPSDRVAYFERHFQRSLAQCAHVIAISEFGRQEIVRTLHLPPERVTCTYMGIRPGLGPMPAPEVAAVLHRLGLPMRYLLCLGTIEPRKNVLLLLRAYCTLPERLRRCWPLLLVGNWGWNTREVAQFLHDEARHRGVIHLGYLAEEHVPVLYNGARALVYPSLYEGFGLPPLEMMACGGAVLASTAGALVETVGGRVPLLHPADLDGWRTALARVVQDDDWWHELRREVVDVARPYTWERCAADTLQVYRSLNGDAGNRPALPAPLAA